MLQDRKRMARRGRRVAILAQLDAEPLGHLVGGHRSGDQQAAVVAHDDEGFAADVLIRRDFARDSREQVGGWHQTVEMAIFIVDEKQDRKSVMKGTRVSEGVARGLRRSFEKTKNACRNKTKNNKN